MPQPVQTEPHERSAYGAPLGTHRYPPTPGVQTNENHAQKISPQKANINIASLNVNGFASPTNNMNGIEKWSSIYQTMKENKIAILALQETHLNNELTHTINACFGKRIQILNSQLPTELCNSAGVAFVINRGLVTPTNLESIDLIQGRAAALKFKWHEEEVLLINVYAPNNKQENTQFWEDLDEKRRSRRLRRPDFLLGDFNVTEDPIDRAPAHLDNVNAISALRNMRQVLGLKDEWRHAHPNERCFTYRANHNGQQIKSRIDRIYCSDEAAKSTFNWKIKQTSVPTDHWMVAAKYAPREAPYIGKGRWTWQLTELKNVELMEKVKNRGIELQRDIENIKKGNIPRAVSNPQTLWANFKSDTRDIAKKHCKETRGKLNKKVHDLERERRAISNNTEIDTTNSARVNEAYLAKKLEILIRIREKDKKDDTRAAISNHGEVLGGIWSAMNKDRKPRDLMYRLKNPNTLPTTYERDSRRMSKLARDYHNSIQDQDIGITDDSPNLRRATEKILNEIPEEQRLSRQERGKTDWSLSYAQTTIALKLSKNGTATGIDGCPYELWKELNVIFKAEENNGGKGFDVIGILTEVFEDIRVHGIDRRLEFAHRWMCPIYKKKDPTEIANYRPITLLNTDYKLLTKTLALQLVEPIHNLIHPDQAGFIPKRSIFNHIRLASTVINYAEVMEENGTIVALDQEKAYDKIRHNYLWKTLESFNLPKEFIKTTKILYENAYTQVIINGVMSEPFQVKRGVRQGDPLSCLLFDLAIEPLACKLRNCESLEGLTFPGKEGKLLVNLFADDTTLYLSQNDKFDTVEKILRDWCDISGAKFNIEKTEIIPIGTEEHRSIIVNTRKIHPTDTEPLDERIRIAKDGEAVRSLGAWIGNRINDHTPWEVILDKIVRKLEIWGRSHPTLYGKRLIIQAVVGGHTQFLTKAQGMPAHIEEAITKIIRNFIWDNDIHPRIATEHLHKPLKEGGLNLLDIRARNDAIELVWLRDFLNLTTSRQTWAIITDILINATAPLGASAVAITNTFIQNWRPPTRGQRIETLNENIRRMLKTASKYETNLAAIHLSPKVRATLPAWYHPGAKQRPLTNTRARCMLNKHNTKTVEDLIKMSRKHREREQNRTHIPSPACICMECVRDRLKGCKNPQACAEEAAIRINDIVPKYNPLAIETHDDNLSLTPNRKRKNKDAHREEETEILFDPTITCRDGIAECFRVFTDPMRISMTPACRQPQRGRNVTPQNMRAYTDGACTNNGKLDAKCGSGVWINTNHPLNKALRIPGEEQSNQIGELAAVIEVVGTLPNYHKLTIITDSRYVIEGLTEHLRKWEDNGWIGIDNANLFKRVAYLLKRRSAPTAFKWVKGHQGVRGNEESDKLAKEGAGKEQPDELLTSIPKDFDLQGAKLATLTQAVAYRGIRERNHIAPRQATIGNLELMRNAIKNLTGNCEKDETLWKSIRKRTIRLRVQQFLFKTIHSTQMIGAVWMRIPGFEQRSVCTTCEETENMSHILLSCTARPVGTIWNLAKRTWPHDCAPWPELSLGAIMGCGCLSAQNKEDEDQDAQRNEQAEWSNDQHKGAARLLQILISEATHLIWVMRCERVIQERMHSVEEIEQRWYKVINQRLTEDRIIATVVKRGTPLIQLVEATWEAALKKTSDLPIEWINNREVLVGRRVHRA